MFLKDYFSVSILKTIPSFKSVMTHICVKIRVPYQCKKLKEIMSAEIKKYKYK